MARSIAAKRLVLIPIVVGALVVLGLLAPQWTPLRSRSTTTARHSTRTSQTYRWRTSRRATYPPPASEDALNPVDENTNNRCFVPGDIEPGVSFTTPSGSGIVLYGAGFGGATSKNIVANRATDPFIIDFTAEDVTAVGMDITAYFNGDPHVQIDIFGANGLLGTTTAAGTLESVSFWGVSSDEVITQIVLTSNIGKGEGVGNIALVKSSVQPW